MGNFLELMIIPFVVALVIMFYFKGKVTIPEFLGLVGIPAAAVGIGLACSYASRTSDTEVWNSQITEREHHHVSCSHSYSCHCRTDRKGNTTCDTCYEHSYDVDWTVHTSSGESLNIDREDRQGLVEPKRWDAAYIGEPFSSTHSFTNYLKANPDSVLFGTKGDVERYKGLIPPYNDRVYDYYKHDPVLNEGVPNVDMNTWNWLIREVNKDLGPKKQVNILVLLVPTEHRDYMLALKDAWLGGKKNDVVVVIGSKDGDKIEWADVLSWTTNADFKIDLRNSIETIGTLTRRDDIVKTIRDTTATKFVRMHMKDMEYLMKSFQPSGSAMLLIFILAVAAQIGFAIWAVRNDITDDSSSSSYSY